MIPLAGIPRQLPSGWLETDPAISGRRYALRWWPGNATIAQSAAVFAVEHGRVRYPALVEAGSARQALEELERLASEGRL